MTKLAFEDNRTPNGLAEELRNLNGLKKEELFTEEHSDEFYLKNGHAGDSTIYYSARVRLKELKLPEGFVLVGNRLIKRQNNGTWTFELVKK